MSNQFHKIPDPKPDVAGRNNPSINRRLRQIIANWRPQGAREPGISTIARFAHRLMGEDGSAYTMENLATAAQGAKADTALQKASLLTGAGTITPKASGNLDLNALGADVNNTSVNAAIATDPAATRAAAQMPETIHLEPGDDIQAAINAAPAGSHLVLMAGTHTPTFVEKTQWDGDKCWVGLQIDKTLTLELAKDCILTNPNAINGIRQTPEIVHDQGRWKTVATTTENNGLEVRADGAITETGSVIIKVETLSGSTPATYSRSDTGVTTYPVVLDQWEALPNNVSFRFTTTNSENSSIGDSFYVSRTAEPIFHIRIGTGTHETAIDGVWITGKGKILVNTTGQKSTLSEVKDISAVILSHGRVNNTIIEGITLDGRLERPILVQAEHTGHHFIDTLCKTRLIANDYVHADGIYTSGGTQYNANGLTIRNVQTLNSRPTLIGHPAHRGEVSRVTVIANDFFSQSGAGIEPNFRLKDFQIIGNRLYSTVFGITLRRGPSYGNVIGNVVYGGGEAVIQSDAATFPSPRSVHVLGNHRDGANPGVVDFGLGLKGSTDQVGAVWGASFTGTRAANSTQSVFCHADQSGSANSYAIMQTTTGGTFLNAATNQTVSCRINNSETLSYNNLGLTFAAAKNISFNETTGTKIGTATTQKIGFWNATPVVQPAANPDTSGSTLTELETEVNELKAMLRSIGLMAS